MTETKDTYIRCDDGAETVQFTRVNFSEGGTIYELTIMDGFTGYDNVGIKGRFRRAWKAFWSKPIYYTGIVTSDKNKIKSFLQDCIDIIDK